MSLRSDKVEFSQLLRSLSDFATGCLTAARSARRSSRQPFHRYQEAQRRAAGKYVPTAAAHWGSPPSAAPHAARGIATIAARSDEPHQCMGGFTRRKTEMRSSFASNQISSVAPMNLPMAAIAGLVRRWWPGRRNRPSAYWRHRRIMLSMSARSGRLGFLCSTLSIARAAFGKNPCLARHNPMLYKAAVSDPSN